MRNRVHDYFEVDLESLWFAVSVDVHQLAREIEGILAERPDP